MKRDETAKRRNGVARCTDHELCAVIMVAAGVSFGVSPMLPLITAELSDG